MNFKLQLLYEKHLKVLKKNYAKAMEALKIDKILIAQNAKQFAFLDDRIYPFKANPHFKHWLDLKSDNAFVQIDKNLEITLFYFAPFDFWHKQFEISAEVFYNFKVIKIKEINELKLVCSFGKNSYFIGSNIAFAKSLNIENINSKSLLNHLDFYRISKTEYEIYALKKANEIASFGHIAAKKAFFEQKSELEIQLAYLKATNSQEKNLPYEPIVALNQNTKILHYTELETKKPKEFFSFLIDAGVNFKGYASDITRTYSFLQKGYFFALIKSLNKYKNKLISLLKAGMNFKELHLKMHYFVYLALLENQIILNNKHNLKEQLFITKHFFVHGLGHYLGLQVHDVGGFLDNFKSLEKDKDFPSLRLIASLKENSIITIEPGIYFIDYFLNKLKNSKFKSSINWSKIEKLKVYGGVRLEDNIVIGKNSNQNLTSFYLE